MKSNYQDLKQRCLECNLEIPKKGLAIYTFGNVSAFDEKKKVFAIKPSGVPYDKLKADDIVVLDLECKVLEGQLNPSTDTGTHAVLYKNFKGIGGVVHTHSPYATAWAQACRSIPVFGTTHADHLSIPVPCTETMGDEMIKGNYEIETGNQIIQTFKKLSHKEVPMVLVAGHGPFAWGQTPEKAVYNIAVLEELAKMALFTIQIDSGAKELKATLIQKHYDRKHGKNSYYGQK